MSKQNRSNGGGGRCDTLGDFNGLAVSAGKFGSIERERRFLPYPHHTYFSPTRTVLRSAPATFQTHRLVSPVAPGYSCMFTLKANPAAARRSAPRCGFCTPLIFVSDAAPTFRLCGGRSERSVSSVDVFLNFAMSSRWRLGRPPRAFGPQPVYLPALCRIVSVLRLHPDSVRWAAAEGVSQDVIAAVLFAA